MELEDAARDRRLRPVRLLLAGAAAAVAAGARDRQRARHRDQLERVPAAAGRPERRGPVDAAARGHELLDEVQLATRHGSLAFTVVSLIPALIFYVIAERQHRGRPDRGLGEGLMATIEAAYRDPALADRGARRRPARAHDAGPRSSPSSARSGRSRSSARDRARRGAAGRPGRRRHRPDHPAGGLDQPAPRSRWPQTANAIQRYLVEETRLGHPRDHPRGVPARPDRLGGAVLPAVDRRRRELRPRRRRPRWPPRSAGGCC